MRKDPHRFFVYCLYRPWNGVPCYIGKGSGNRIQQHFSDGDKHCNPHLANILKKAGGKLPFVLLFEGLDEREAFQREIELITSIGRTAKGGPLVNMTDGGEGVSGFSQTPSPETIEKIRASALARGPQQAERMRGNKLTLGLKLSHERIEQIRQHNLGSKRTAETKAKMSAKAKARWADPTQRAAMEEHNRSIAKMGAEASKRYWAEKRGLS